MAILFALLSMVFWGLALFIAAVVSRKIGNIATLFWMQFFGFLLGSVYFFINPQTASLPKLFHFIPLLILIALLQTIAYLSFYKGTQKGHVSLVAPLGSSWSLVTVILSIFFLKESLMLHQFWAIFLILFGIVALSISFKEMIQTKQLQVLAGTKEGIVAMLGWGISLFLLIIPSKAVGWFLPALGFRFIILLLLLPYALYTKTPLFPALKKTTFGLLLAVGIFDILAFFSYSFGVSLGYGAIVAPVSSTYSLVTILLGVLILKEKVQLRQILGICVIVGGVILMSL